MNKNIRLLGVGAGAVVLGAAAFFGAQASAGALAEQLSLPAADSVEAPDFPRNDDGLTYGSLKDVQAAEHEPDLILVLADQGVEGYVYADELTPQFKSPEEAQAWQEAKADKQVLTVYAKDGKTAVGTFTVGGGTTVLP